MGVSGAYSDLVEEHSEIGNLTFGFYFHPAVVQVLYPTSYTETAGASNGEEPEAHPLHPAGNVYVNLCVMFFFHI
jgi:hypothetical protein